MSNHSGKFCVSAAEITRNFGMWQDKANDGPIVVTHHGRPRCVLMSADKFDRYNRPTNLEAQRAVDFFDPDVLIERLDEGFLILDRLLEITAANSVASVIFEASRTALIGTSFSTLLPDFVGSLSDALIRRVLRSREPIRTSIAFQGERFDTHVFPWPGGLAMTIKPFFIDETSEGAKVENEALHQLIGLNDDLGTATLSVRGTLFDVQEGLAKMVGMEAQRLEGVRLLDLILRPDRARVGSIIEVVLRDARRSCVNASLLNNQGDDVPVCISMAPLHSDSERRAKTTIRRRHIATTQLFPSVP